MVPCLRRCETDLINWRENLPKNYAFNERHMYMFRVSRHLDIFLMIHAYYHQSCILLFGIFLPDSLEPNLEPVAAQAPSEFLQDCREEFLFHAREISHLIQRILNIEPEHLFRDPWFSLCIWDGTCALLASIPWQETDAETRSQAARLLTTNPTGAAEHHAETAAGRTGCMSDSPLEEIVLSLT